jgi:hypothetical protein
VNGRGATVGPQPADANHTERSAPGELDYAPDDLDVGPHLLDDLFDDKEWLRSLRMPAWQQGIVEIGQRVDAAKVERKRLANVLGGLAKVVDGRGKLDANVAAAFQVVAAACDVSPRQFREVVDALDRAP